MKLNYNFFLIIFATALIFTIGCTATEPGDAIQQSTEKPIEKETTEEIDKTSEIEKSEYQISCACGCCESDKPVEEIDRVKCVYKSKGESIQDEIRKDKELMADICPAMGCSPPVKYVYCN